MTDGAVTSVDADVDGDAATRTHAHRPCYDGWNDPLLEAQHDPLWRVEFSLHAFVHGTVQASLLPIATCEGSLFSAPPPDELGELLTVIITSSPVRSNPSTRMLQECVASLDVHGGLASCRKLIMCDGFKRRARSRPKVGIVTDAEAALYTEYVAAVGELCRSDAPGFARARKVRLARRQGSAYAIREALEGHVTTPFVLIVPHDCVIARPVPLRRLAAAMEASDSSVRYVKLLGQSTLTYVQAVLSQHGVRLAPTTAHGDGLPLWPMLRYMDNVALVSARFLRDEVFARGSPVRRATFIEDTFGKTLQMHRWLGSAAFARREPPQCGCFLFDDGAGVPMMRHLDGKVYLGPEQRAAAGLPPMKTDWTADLAASAAQQVQGAGAAANAAADATNAALATDAAAAAAAAATHLKPLRDALCWAWLSDEGGCADPACSRLHPRHTGTAVCGRHLTTLLGLWGRRRRPPCPGGACCAKAHPTPAELEAALVAALPKGSRLHAHRHASPRFGGLGGAGCGVCGSGGVNGACLETDGNGAEEATEGASGSRSLFVAASDLGCAAADAALVAAAPMPLRVAIDVGYDGFMSEVERKSLATQCGLCHGTASLADHRSHVALAICCGTPAVAADEADTAIDGADGGGGGGGGGGVGSSSLSLLRAAGLEQWRPLAWRSADGGGAPLSLLDLPGPRGATADAVAAAAADDASAERATAPADELVYLSPEAPEVLGELRANEVYVIGGLVDKRLLHGASLRRAAALGVRCARLPLAEHLPASMRGRSNSLDGLNINCVFRLLVEWSRRRDWTAAIAAAFDGSQRNCCTPEAAGMIHPNGYWDGPRAAHQHQHDATLCDAVLAFFLREGARSVVDLGCGLGQYVRAFSAGGLAAAGFDGNPATPRLSKGACGVLDLSVVADVGAAAPYDWVLSLEVGEHLPKQHEAAFLENCHRHNGCGMVLSWATRGQGGTGHVNEQDNDYVKAAVCAMGYANDLEAERELRGAARFSYFQRTVMVFRRVQ